MPKVQGPYLAVGSDGLMQQIQHEQNNAPQPACQDGGRTHKSTKQSTSSIITSTRTKQGRQQEGGGGGGGGSRAARGTARVIERAGATVGGGVASPVLAAASPVVAVRAGSLAEDDHWLTIPTTASWQTIPTTTTTTTASRRDERCRCLMSIKAFRFDNSKMTRTKVQRVQRLCLSEGW